MPEIIEPFDDDEELEDVFLDDADAASADGVPLPLLEQPAPRPRRRRVRMGDALAKLGDASRAHPLVDPAKDLARRVHVEQAQRLLKGGKSRGAEKGYGAAQPPGE